MSIDITGWLRELGLEQYAPAFRDNAVDARILPSLTLEDLKDLGVTVVGHPNGIVPYVEAPPDVPMIAADAGALTLRPRSGRSGHGAIFGAHQTCCG
jgi:hypothetical protein